MAHADSSFDPHLREISGAVVCVAVGGGPCQDVDDVGTLCMLNALADAGEVILLAIMVNTVPSVCTAAVSVLQHYYGRDDVPIGAYKGESGYNVTHPFVSLLANNWPSPIRSKAQVPDATELYRRVLAAQDDRTVVIASVGMLSNLASLLSSRRDAHSSLNGRDLFARKVRLLGMMAGKYPAGRECNAIKSARTFAHVLEKLPPSVPTFFLGYEAGASVLTGGRLTNCTGAANPCRQACACGLRHSKTFSRARGPGPWALDPGPWLPLPRCPHS